MNREPPGETGDNRRKGCQTHETAEVVHIIGAAGLVLSSVARMGRQLHSPSVGHTEAEPFFPRPSIEETSQVPPLLRPSTCMYEVHPQLAVRTATLPQGRIQPCIYAKTLGGGGVLGAGRQGTGWQGGRGRETRGRGAARQGRLATNTPAGGRGWYRYPQPPTAYLVLSRGRPQRWAEMRRGKRYRKREHNLVLSAPPRAVRCR